MRAPRLQPAFHQRVFSQSLDNPNVSHGALAGAGVRGAAAPAVAPVVDQTRLDPSPERLAADQGEIAALDGVFAELLAQMPCGLRGAGEDDQAAGVAVKSMDREETWPAARRAM